MKQLFKVNPEHRITAEKALQSYWITKFFDMNHQKIPASMQRASLTPRKSTTPTKPVQRLSYNSTDHSS